MNSQAHKKYLHIDSDVQYDLISLKNTSYENLLHEIYLTFTIYGAQIYYRNNFNYKVTVLHFTN